MKKYKYYVVYETCIGGVSAGRGCAEVVYKKKIKGTGDIEAIAKRVVESLNDKEGNDKEGMESREVMITNYILMDEVVEGEGDMEKLSRLEDIAVKMAELYSKETGEVYDNDLKESIYKILVERY